MLLRNCLFFKLTLFPIQFCTFNMLIVCSSLFLASFRIYIFLLDDDFVRRQRHGSFQSFLLFMLNALIIDDDVFIFVL